MKTEEAVKIAEKVSDLKDAWGDLERFLNTKEFCKIKITGEDGTERQFSFTITDNPLVIKVRKTVEDYLHERVRDIENEIKEL